MKAAFLIAVIAVSWLLFIILAIVLITTNDETNPIRWYLLFTGITALAMFNLYLGQKFKDWKNNIKKV